MLIDIANRNLVLDETQKEWVERRLMFALARFASRIQRVTVTFADVNGTRGGADKECRIRVKLGSAGEVIVEGTDTSVEAVVAALVDRVARSVARKIEKDWDHSVSYGSIMNPSRVVGAR